MTKKFITGIPNRGGGIGHAFTDWAKAFYTAQTQGIEFLYSPFSGANSRWETVLGLGRSCQCFNENNVDICFYSSQSTIDAFLSFDIPNVRAAFVVDGNHTECKLKYPSGYDSISRYIRRQYLLSRRERPFPSIFEDGKIGVGVHIRRGNILQYERFHSRAQSYEHFDSILTLLHESLPVDSLDVVILTNERTEGIRALADKFNARAIDCGNDIQDLHSLAICDIMLTSNSGFSYLATLINRSSLKIVPDNFWHHWPLDSIVFDGSNVAAASLQQKFAKWKEGKYRPSPLRSYKSERIWHLAPSMVATSNREFRDANYDNIASRIIMFPLAAQNEAAGRIDFPSYIQIRKLYGCIVDTVSQAIKLDSGLCGVTQYISEPSAFIEFNTCNRVHLDDLKLIGMLIRLQFNEAIMGRTILIPPDFPISWVDLLALGLHSSISLTSVVSPLVYCSNLMALRVNLQYGAENQ